MDDKTETGTRYRIDDEAVDEGGWRRREKVEDDDEM